MLYNKHNEYIFVKSRPRTKNNSQAYTKVS